MHVRLPRPLRVGLPAVAVLALSLTACGDPTAPAPSAPPSSPAPSSTLAPAAGGTGSAGSDGLTVRYLGDDGSVKTVRVEDFPR